MSSVYGQAANISPQLPGVQNQAWDTVSNQLNSTVSPATQRLLQDKAASMGVELGLPSWNAASEGTLARILGTAEQQQQEGVKNFQGLTATTKSLTNDPATEYARQQQNNVWASAPDPAAAAKLQQSMFDQYINSISKQYGGGNYNPTPTSSGPWYDPNSSGRLRSAYADF